MNSLTGSIQIIEKGGHPAFVVIPHDKWVKMREILEEDADIHALDQVKSALARGEEIMLPSAVAKRIMNGEHPLAVLRGWRGLTQKELGKRAGVSPLSISHIETGVRQGGLRSMQKIAKVLDVPIEALTGY